MTKKTITTDKVRITTYIPRYIYDLIKKDAPIYQSQWESELFRRIIFEWLGMQKKGKS